jgi:peptidoglycan biosynthesis protein MviN/MurJ (putative lipid II flippase)
MFLYVRKSFMIFKILLACIAFMAAIIALLGTSQNSLLLTQETGKQLGIVMALVFGLAFVGPTILKLIKEFACCHHGPSKRLSNRVSTTAVR